MHAPIKVALEFLPPIPHSGPRGLSAQGLHPPPPPPPPRVSRRLSAQGAGASPAGLSAAIFPPPARGLPCRWRGLDSSCPPAAILEL